MIQSPKTITLEERMQQDLQLLQAELPGIGNSFPSHRKEWIAKRTSCDEATPDLGSFYICFGIYDQRTTSRWRTYEVFVPLLMLDFDSSRVGWSKYCLAMPDRGDFGFESVLDAIEFLKGLARDLLVEWSDE